MGRILTVVLSLECDHDACERKAKYDGLTWQAAKQDAEREGWIIHSDGQSFCCRECSDKGLKVRPPRIRPGGKRQMNVRRYPYC